jgi:hypothetical protein
MFRAFPFSRIQWIGTWWKFVREICHGRRGASAGAHSRNGVFLVLLVDVVVAEKKDNFLQGILKGEV